jgi:CheY-like chemotaxis protein
MGVTGGTGRSGRTLLVVEDDPDIRAMLAQLLEFEGYEVFSAGNGREALERLRQGVRPVLLLVDLMMPVMDGWQFLEERSHDPELASIPVVVFSGDGSIGNSAGLPVSGYLRKPIDCNALLETVGRFATG